MNKFKSLSKKDKAEYIAIVALYPFFKLFSWLGKSLKLFGTKKRQITASVLTFALIMTMLPTMSFTAFAATPTTEVYVGSVVMNATNQYAKTDADGKVTLGGSESDYNVKFDSTTGTLTLKNAIINESFVQGSYKSVIHCASDLKLILTDGTVNTITESNTEKERFSIAIYVGLSLAISGGGMLTVTGGETNGNSIGIASNSTLTIDGGTIIATAGDAQSYSYGILSQNEDIVINGGTVVGVGGNANRNASYGIDSLSKSIIINGGTVTGTGGKASISVGIISEGKVSITINGGTVTANSTSTTGTITAMNMAPDLSAYTPPVPTVTASTDTNGSSPVSYNASDIATYKYLKIEPSTYTVVGNGDMFGGDWDATNDSNNMVYDATLGKYVKVFDNIKQGDYEFKITLNNSWVTSWGDSSRPTGSAVAKVTKDGMSVKIIFDPTSEEIDTEIYMPDTAAHPTSWSELQTAINAGGEIKLTQNIVAESTDDQLNVPSTSTVTIDLNGYKIDRNLTTAVDNGSVFYINRGNLTINDTSASKTGQITGGKTTGNGGGVYLHGGTFTMEGGSITGNIANNNTCYGGGVYLNNNSTFTLNGGSITSNTAFFGGGVGNDDSTFTMSGGGITDNEAYSGGGVIVHERGGTFTMIGGSITGNTADYGGGVYNNDIFNVSGSATVKDNKKFSGTTNNVFLPSGEYITVTGALSGEIGVTTRNKPTAAAPITITQGSTNPEYTLTASDVAKLISDVDGYGVVLSGDVAVLQEYKIDTWAKLQEAINAGGEIKLTQDIVAGSGDARLNVPSTSTVTIDLNGYKIDRNLTTAVDNGSVFYIDGGNLTIADTSTAKNGQITGGKSTGDCGGVFVCKGTFTMTGGNIVGNTANVGGGVYNRSGTFTMNGGNIVGNKAEIGGGVNNYGDSPDFTMNGGSIRDNTASFYGGGVNITKGCFTMSGGSITDNTAKKGGGVYVSAGTFTMTGGNITGNTAANDGGGVYNDGGGVYNDGGTFTMNGGSIKYNTATSMGGGVFNWNNFNVSGSATVKDNTLTSDTTKSNVYLRNGHYITVIGALSGKIGVTTENKPTAAASVTITKASTYPLTANDVSKLINDVDGYEIVKSGDVAVLQKILGTLTANEFHYIAPTALSYDGTTKAATVTAKSGVSCGAITVKYYQGNTLVESPTDAGIYTVQIDVAANDNYKAATDLEFGTFTITAKALTKTDLTVTDLDDEIYTGNQITPVPTVKYGNVTLVKDTDYTLSYGANTAIGKGSVTINFKGNYSGSAQYEFDIAYGTATTAMYTVSEPNSNNWYNSSINVSAVNGYTISTTATDFANGIRLSVETANGSQDFYVKDAYGKIYKGNFTYKLDKTAPDGDITFNTSTVKKLLNTISFGLFFKDNINVEITSTDALCGVAKTEYFKSTSVLSESEVNAISDWTAYSNNFSITAKDKDKFVIYVRVTDKAGNVTYFGSDGVTFDTVAPSISAENNKTYCAAVEVTVTDDNLDTVTLDNTTVTLTDGKLTVSPKSGTQTIVATDKAGNKTTVIITVNDGHTPSEDDGDCTTGVSCKYCYVLLVPSNNHDFGGAYISDGANGHYQECQNAGCTKHSETVAHTGEDDNNCETEYRCSDCGDVIKAAQAHEFSGAYIHDDIQHWHVCTHDGCTVTDTKTAHQYNIMGTETPPTYFKDGSRVDTCVCGATNTVVLPMLIDKTAPTATMTIGENTWNSLLNSISFGLFFKDTQTVTVTANDNNESGVDKTYYYLAGGETTDFTGVSWTEFTNTFSISPNNKYVVYVKVTDKFGNKVIINSDGIVLENIVPQISAENGKTYCAAIEITVTDDNLDTVTLNDDKVTLINGKFTVSPKSGTQTIVATDKAGNKTTVTITVNDGHTWDNGKVTTKPTAANDGIKTYTCEHCGETKTELVAKIAPSIVEGTNGKFTQGGKDGLTFKSDAALSNLISVSVDGNVIDTDKYTTAEGSTVVTLTANYLNTLTVGKHTLDIKSASGIASTEFTIEAKTTNTPKPTDPTKPGDTTSPQTGDNSNMVLWICLLFVSGGVLTTLGLAGKKRRKQNEK